MEKKPRKKTGGRVPGSKNRNTMIGKNVSETLKNWLGFDDESVQRTGQIDGDGYRGRLALRAMWEDERPIDPQYVALAKFLFSYAYGLPGRAVERNEQRPLLVFASTTGHVPWSDSNPLNKEMNERSARMIAEGDARLALEAAERKAEVIEAKADNETDLEALESVAPPPEPPEAFGRGR